MRMRSDIPLFAKSRARAMRREPTDAERKLWYALRDRRMQAVKFRRLAPVGPYIADFLCVQHKLVVVASSAKRGASRIIYPSPALRGRRWREAPDEGLTPLPRQATLGSNSGQHVLSRFQNLMIPKSQDSITVAHEPSVARAIPDAFPMLRTIGLDDQLMPNAKKVGDIGTHRRLPAKFNRLHAPVT